jgi:hypothetical protein
LHTITKARFPDCRWAGGVKRQPKPVSSITRSHVEHQPN